MSKYGILDANVHARLIQSIDEVCATAGIPPMYVYKSLKDYTEGKEVYWISNYNTLRHQYSGLALVGVKKSELRIMALCGAFIRMFINARVISLGNVIPLKDGSPMEDVIEPSVLLIPNLQVKTHGGKTLTAWQVQALYDVMLSRMTTGKQTIVFIESLESLGNEYGQLFKEHIENNYLIVRE